MTDATPTAGSQNTDTAGAPASGSQSIPYSRFSEVVAQKNALEAQMQELQNRLKGIEEKQLADQQNWQSLAEKRQQEATEAQLSAKQAQMDLLRYQVGSAQGVPAPLIERLRGGSREEFEADAKQILALIPKPAAAVTDAGQPQNPEKHTRVLTPTEQAVYEKFAALIPGLKPDEYAREIDGGT